MIKKANGVIFEVGVDDWIVWEDWKHNTNFRSNPIFHAAKIVWIGAYYVLAEMTPFYHVRLRLDRAGAEIIARGTRREMIALVGELRQLCKQREQAIKIAEDNVVDVAAEEIRKIRAAIKGYNKRVPT